jgi:predicted amidohydrolase YtcJ
MNVRHGAGDREGARQAPGPNAVFLERRAMTADADLIVVADAIHGTGGTLPAQALAVTGDRFTYVGSVAGALALRGPQTEVLDAGSQTVLPGIVDAHLHLTNLGLKLQQVDLDRAASYRELVERTEAFAQRSSDEWILGRGWDENRWRDKAFPSHQELSAAIPNRPVALARVDGHALLANARAMAIAGVDESTSDPSGGRIVRAHNGKPTGIFVDAALDLIYAKVPKPSRERLVRATRAAIAECNRWGITAVAEPGCDEAVLAAHAELLANDEYSIRNYAMLEDDASLIEARTRAGIVDGAYNGRLWVRAIKVYADGALGSRGAALLAPYSDDAENSGLILTPQARIENVATTALERGFQVCVHAIGDRANRMVLDAFESALRAAPGADPRLRIEHAQVVAREDVHRFAKLRVIPSMQATHALSDMAWARERLGPERILGAYAWRSLIDAGASVANGTDAPVESPSTPRTFYASIASGGWYPQEGMSRSEALASMTIWAARANFQEGSIGSISPGKFADFVVIDRDWMKIDPDEVLRTKIVSTYFGGRRVYGAPLT